MATKKPLTADEHRERAEILLNQACSWPSVPDGGRLAPQPTNNATLYATLAAAHSKQALALDSAENRRALGELQGRDPDEPCLAQRPEDGALCDRPAGHAGLPHANNGRSWPS